MPRRLFGVQFLNVAEEEDLPVGLGQLIDTGPDLSARLGPREPGQGVVSPGPDREAVMTGLIEGRKQVLNADLSAPRPRPQSRETDVDHDAVQPSPQGRVTLEAVEGAERREEGVLHGV